MNKAELIEQFQKLSSDLGRHPSRDEFTKITKTESYRKEFGSYGEFKNAASINEQIITAPKLPEDDLPTKEIISEMVKRFDKRHENHKAKKWMEFKVDTDQPIGITFLEILT